MNRWNPYLTRTSLTLNSACKSLKSLPYATFSLHLQSSKSTPYASISGVTNWNLQKSPKSLPYADDSRLSNIRRGGHWQNPHLTRAFFDFMRTYVFMSKHIFLNIFNTEMKILCAEILTLLGTFLRLFEASNPYIYLKHFTQAFLDLERWNPHLTRASSNVQTPLANDVNPHLTRDILP